MLPAVSYLSSSDPRVHFGLGTVSAVDAIEVRWVDGAREVFRDAPAGWGVDRELVLEPGAGEAP